MDSKKGIIFTGAVIGILAVILVRFGNPVNMGICIACFIRDTAGSLGLHRADVVQYIRPEIIGIVLGAFMIAFGKKEFDVRGGSSPFIRFILGFVVMIGALMFLGCPLRMVLRLGGGDLNALIGLAGFVVGIIVGIIFLKSGFSLKRTYRLSKFEGYLFPMVNIGLFILLLTAPAFIFFSKKGPGAAHASVWIALAAGLIIGVLVQRTRLCMVGGIRDAILFKDTYLILGFISIFVFATLGNLYFGFYKLGFSGQSIAHADGLWNFLGMALAGWGSVLLGGCPLRQLILAAEGNVDSVITILGMSAGAAFAHNFSLASSAQGPSPNGKIAVLIGFALLLMIAYFNLEKDVKATVKGGVRVGTN
ncbi:YedE family putative selenium transporter [Desulfosporosinus metallidurans]|uniref:Glutamate synthase [NADPH] large chain n=1 Tax=Desulfosporosinus metallidurans TaxID=1888891 RepID=A0A1Q8QME5_9FIRM|nr:YedE family putative selenium transporter [Desulfosporosinus metallidurans]OLN28504.1 Glutamate synthase [NADPH] large chain [Desulfosporosinus metallidurans]